MVFCGGSETKILIRLMYSFDSPTRPHGHLTHHCANSIQARTLRHLRFSRIRVQVLTVPNWPAWTRCQDQLIVLTFQFSRSAQTRACRWTLHIAPTRI